MYFTLRTLPNILWFQLLRWEDWMLFLVIYDKQFEYISQGFTRFGILQIKQMGKLITDENSC